MSDHFSPPTDQSNHDQPDSTESQEDLISDKPSSKNPRSHRSTWAYIKWVWWTTIAGLFDCSTPILTAPFDNNTWPSSGSTSNNLSSTSRNSGRNTVSKSDLNTHSDQYCVIHSDVTAQTTPKSPTPERRNCISQFKNPEHCQHEDLLSASVDIVEEPLETVELDLPAWSNIGYFCEFDQDLDGIPLSRLACSKISREPLLVDEICSSEFSYPGSFTQISSLNADALNGLINIETRDLLIKKILNSVIPRNLSDSSEVYIPPDARRMYAWTKPPAEIEPDDENQQTKFDLEMSSTASDDQSADPGGRTLSDHSFSPLSPSTVDGAVPMEEYLCKSPDRPNDLGLPKVDRSDQTLAWAMSNLQINMTNESGLHSDSDSVNEKHASQAMASDSAVAAAVATDPSEYPVRKTSPADRPPLPSSQHRPSRDRSPATKLVPHKTTDPSYLPTFMPFDGAQVLEPASTSNGTETVKPKRSSSLKSSRTPPGTPVQKAVRFADALGLDLTTVRHVFDSEAPPKIPASATFDLKLDSDESIAKIGAKQFGLCFAQPGSASNFIRHVLSQTVCLEDAHIDMPRGVLTGTIRVKSLGFEKRVFVRITYNNWITFFDSPASYVHGSHDGATDRFSFSVVFPDTMVPGDKAVFAIRYETHTGEQFWDNNHGQNYAVTCYAKATDLAGDGSWVHFL